MSKIKDNNFIVIPGFIVNKYKLKGNDLLIYSIIYGFSQGGSCFCGSIQYLCDWTNSSRPGVKNSLDHLIELGLIEKIEGSPTNKYRATIEDEYLNLVDEDLNKVENTPNKLGIPSQQTWDNNIDNNINNNINKYAEQNELNNKVDNIISYFNSTCNTNFKTTTNSTKKLIRKHLKEGFSLEDFKKVNE